MRKKRENLQEPAHVTDVFGPCPDCAGDACTMGCGHGALTFREVVAGAVLEMETAQLSAHAPILKLLKRIDPNLRLSALERYEARSNTPLASEAEEERDQSMTPDEIKAAGAALGLKKSELAEMLGITPARTTQTMSDWITGRQQMDMARSRLLRAYLDGYRPDDWPQK